MVKPSIPVWQWHLITDVVKHDHRVWWGDRLPHYQHVCPPDWGVDSLSEIGAKRLPGRNLVFARLPADKLAEAGADHGKVRTRFVLVVPGLFGYAAGPGCARPR